MAIRVGFCSLVAPRVLPQTAALHLRGLRLPPRQGLRLAALFLGQRARVDRLAWSTGYPRRALWRRFLVGGFGFGVVGWVVLVTAGFLVR